MLVGGSEEKKKFMSPLPPFIVSKKHDDTDECDICGKNGADGQGRGL